MRLGDLDGLREVYDRLGHPILEEDEEILAERKATAFALFEGKKTKGQPLFFHGQGEVGITMTDRRLIVLIDPSLGTARRVLELPGEESWTKGKELFEVIQGRGRYYLVLRWHELPRIKVPSPKRSTATIPIRPEQGGAATMMVDRETSAWLERAKRLAR